MSNGKKQTVVILAEDKSWRYSGWSGAFNPGSFPDQAQWWKDDNADVFNTVIIPYYNGWEGHELSDAKEIIDNIPGTVTIGFMGHSGSEMGGYPISEIGKQKSTLRALKYLRNDARNVESMSSISNLAGEGQ